MSLRIEDYALIGDCHTAALVGRDGAIDWLCVPRFDSPACFSALLGTPRNGRWRIAPAKDLMRVARRYRHGTLILESDFETSSGVARVIDLMPRRTDAPRLIRIVEGVRGEVPMRMDVIIRPEYGWIVPWVRRLEGGGIYAVAGRDTLRFRTQVPLRGEDFTTVGEFTISAGQRVPFDAAWHTSHRPPPPDIDPEALLAETERWWTDWSSRCRCSGHWGEHVRRSLITLKALTYAPSGGIVAAPTTSLPEQLGGVRNWDYRFCWLRDATFTLYALMGAGYVDEARAWREWLLRAVAGSGSQIQTLYGVSGERWLPELEIPWLPGYADSRPVRVGNAASNQFQLDVFGEVLDTLYQCRRVGLEAYDESWRVAREMLSFLESHWKEPDEGIWEVRGPRRHFTHSKVLAWVGIDRAIKGMEQFGREGNVERWRVLRQEIHDDICKNAFDPELGAFVQYYGAKTLDAAVLLMPLVGFLPPEDPRIRGTVQAIERHLLRDGFIARYTPAKEVDGLPPGEGAFLPCTFWFVDNLMLQGREDDAHRLFEQLVGLSNDVGLLSEEYDWNARRLVGNFPQALSHVALVNSVANLFGGVEAPALRRQL
jgi:GH15 family glucan-1,4-alpha-glucosidase